MADEERIAELICRQLRNRLSIEEKEELEAWTNASDVNRGFMENHMHLDSILSAMEAVLKRNDRAIIKKFNKLCPEISLETPVVRLTNWYAGRIAIVLLVAGLFAGGIFFFRHKQGGQICDKTYAVYKGSQDANRARIILQSGITISLDKILPGGSFEEKGWRITKIDSERISYSRAGPKDGDVCYHILTTSHGQGFHVLLPDGSEIQLNTATSIRYAVMGAAVAKGKREVHLEGEAYFSVAKNSRLPFEVLSHNARVTVLSTDFEVKDYGSDFLATVVKGAIKVSDGNTSLKVKEGQAVRIDSSFAGIRKIKNYDATMELAWRSNFFDLTDLNIRKSMEVLAKWYGKEEVVIMPGVDTVSPGLLGGGLIRKGWELNKLLDLLGEGHHLHLYSEGKKIIVQAR